LNSLATAWGPQRDRRRLHAVHEITIARLLPDISADMCRELQSTTLQAALHHLERDSSRLSRVITSSVCLCRRLCSRKPNSSFNLRTMFPFFSLSFVSEVWKLMSRLLRQSSLPWNVIIALENSEQSQSLHRHTCVTTGYCPTLWSPQTEGLALPGLRCSRMAVHDDPPVEQLMLHLTYSPEF
jgi:hypothetical protein